MKNRSHTLKGNMACLDRQISIFGDESQWSHKKSINMWHHHWLECTWQWHVTMLLKELNLQHNLQHFKFATLLRISAFKLVLHARPPSAEINNITAADKQDEVGLSSEKQEPARTGRCPRKSLPYHSVKCSSPSHTRWHATKQAPMTGNHDLQEN